MVARTNRSTSRLPELPPRLAPGSPSTPLRYVSLFVYIYHRIVLDRVHEELSKKKKSESFIIDFFLSFFEENDSF